MDSDKLTELGIKKAKAGDKDKKLWDGQGLYLLLTTSGSKYWRLKYRFDKKEKVFAIGVWPEVKLKEARQKRNEAKLILKSGNDPSLVKKNQKFNQHIQHSNTFGSISNEWIEMKRKEWKEDHSNDVKRAFEIHLLPDLGHRPINEITSADLLMVLKKIENQGIIEYWGESNDMPKIFKISSIVVLPSYREGMPKSLLEAAACGRAVVTTNVPGCKETVIDKYNGLIVPPKNSNELYLAMKKMISYKDREIKNMGTASRKIAEEVYDSRKVSLEYYEIIFHEK